MTLFVTIAMEEGAVILVTAFLTKQSAEIAEQAWRQQNGILDDEALEYHAFSNTGVATWECELKP